MTFNEAYLTLAKHVLSNDYDAALSACDNFQGIELDEDFRGQIRDLLSDPQTLKGKNVDALVDKLITECPETLKALLELSRETSRLTGDKIRKTKAYTLVSTPETEYYSDEERALIIRALSNVAVLSRDITLIDFLLGKVQEYGI